MAGGRIEGSRGYDHATFFGSAGDETNEDIHAAPKHLCVIKCGTEEAAKLMARAEDKPQAKTEAESP
jgi:hypothetical protein